MRKQAAMDGPSQIVFLPRNLLRGAGGDVPFRVARVQATINM
jgi:hypothetical protein